jgi:hypothetical protein
MKRRMAAAVARVSKKSATDVRKTQAVPSKTLVRNAIS